MPDDVKCLVLTRGHLRQQITTIRTNVLDENTLSSYTKSKKVQIISKLKSISEDIKILNGKIITLKWDPEKSTNDATHNTELETIDIYEEKIIESVSILEDSIADSYSVSNFRPGNANQQNYSLLRPLSAPLPKFESREHESLEKFFYNFEAVVDKYNYSEYEKFIILKQQITGSALVLANSLESSRQSYKEAKDLLTLALASPLSQKYDTIQRLLDLKMPYTKDPYAFIGEIRIITESFKTLEIDIDLILQYCIWRGLNDTFQNQIIQITNVNKPSLKQINDNIFAATERYLTVTKKYNERKGKNDQAKFFSSKTVSGMAANVNYKDQSKFKDFRACILCTTTTLEADHPIYRCENFKSPTEKLSKIKLLKGCILCANLNHETSDCKFKFKSKCRKCFKWHFSFLCTKSDSESTSRPVTSIPQTTSNIVWNGSALQSNFNDESLLPTFSCLMNNCSLRCMKDSGSQSNFILEKVANENDLIVVRNNIPLIIHGINSAKEYLTKIVKVPLRLNDNIHTVNAVCIPEISIKLKLPNLGQVVNRIVQKGYSLADKFLQNTNDEVTKVQFILGAESSHCLPETDILFGKPIPSVFSETHIGILLKGNLKRMIENIDALPNVNSFKVNSLSIQADSQNKTESNYNDSIINNNVVRESKNAEYSLNELKIGANLAVMTEQGEIIESELQRVTEAILSADKANLEKHCSEILHYDKDVVSEVNVETNDSLVRFVLDNTTQNEDGRLIMPLTWNGKVSHLLGKNYFLSKQILKSNLKKLSKNKEKLLMTDDVFKEQEEQGVIEKIGNLDQFILEHPEHSFLPHMSVLKTDRNTTKCRVVFLSNLCEQDKSRSLTLSHNQTIYPGPNLNKKLSTALLHLRFDKFILCFDLVKAFLQIELKEVDQNRLLFLWYRNVQREDYEIIGYRTKRLPFGIPCSPSILMIALYKILIIDSQDNPPDIKAFKKLVYHLMYMDNGCYSCNDSKKLEWAYDLLKDTFEPYKFSLQQYVTNYNPLQSFIDVNTEEITPDLVKVFGLNWNRLDDTLSTRPLHLNEIANTKRLILQSIAKNFDLFGFNIPVLNRCRLFMHDLQCNSSLGWDEKLSDLHMKKWKNISKQVNASSAVFVKRFIGKRDSRYRLISFTDASKSIYGTVIYIQDLNSMQVSFLLAKNRLVGKQLREKSTPSLEFQAIVLGAEVLINTFQELTANNSLIPKRIEELQAFSDSMVSLTWINAHINKFDKTQQKRSIFITNRLNTLSKLCEIYPIEFSFCSGFENPADHVSRPTSAKQLAKSNYQTGPKFLQKISDNNLSRADILKIIIPNPHIHRNQSCETTQFQANIVSHEAEHLIPLDKFSNFQKLVNIHGNVLKFINILKTKLMTRDPDKYKHLSCLDSDENFFVLASTQIIMRDQHIRFPECIEYFESPIKRVKDLPNIVGQLNIYPDSDGLLRVRSKCCRGKDKNKTYFPILLSKNSILTKLIVSNLHTKLSHAGCYTLLHELRKRFWIPQILSLVKLILRGCMICKRLNSHPIKINQNSYRDFRINPSNIPFRFLFLDHLGPYIIKLNDQNTKVWILCFTCLWSRAVNLKICLNLTTDNFLRAFQMHCFEFGLPELILSDLGSQIVSASHIITDFVKDSETQLFFQENNIKSPTFDQYYKGNNSLGALVESCVKLTKKLIYGAIRNNILSYFDFEFIISQTVHLTNRRPIAFKESLRSNTINDLPEPITPELLLKGHNLVSLNIIPGLQPDPDPDPSWKLSPVDKARSSFKNLRKVRERLIELYNEEFLSNLIIQATNKKDRYKPVNHKALKFGDIVLMKEKHLKPSNFPMGIVKEVQINSLNEVTGALILRGKTRELVKRHVNSLIPLMSTNQDRIVSNNNTDIPFDTDAVQSRTSLPRTASTQSSRDWKKLMEQNLV